MKNSELLRMVKFDDFAREPNLINVSLDLVGVIAKIGELKYAVNETGKGDKPEPIRELQVYDDTYNMVRLILRNCHAKQCEHYKIDDIISLKNVRMMRVQNRFVMTTLSDTIIAVNTTSYEVTWLKQWLVHNRKDIVRNNFAQFNNLSMTPAKPKKERVETFSSQSDCPPAKMMRMSPTSTQPLEKVEGPSKVEPPLSSPSSPDDLKHGFVNGGNLTPSKTQDSAPNEFVELMSDDENGAMVNNQEEKKEQNQNANGEQMAKDDAKKEERILEQVERETSEAENGKKDVKFETYNVLMHSPILKNEWDEEKDQYLVHFITKNPCNLQNDQIYSKLISEMPDVFAQTTPAMLKERVFALSSVRNYLYLMKLCGGDHLTTEKEKALFIVKVEQLRESMKLIKTS